MSNSNNISSVQDSKVESEKQGVKAHLNVFFKRLKETFNKFKGSFFSSDPLNQRDESVRATRQANLFAIIALISGVIVAFILPPLLAPDEQAHLLNVFKVSHFQFLPTVRDGTLGAMITADEAKFLMDYNDVFSTHMSWEDIFAHPITNSEPSTFFPSIYANLNPFSYIVSAIALAIFRFIMPGLDIFSCMLVARLANLVFAIIVIRLAIKTAPVFKNTMFLLALMPMTLQQIASTSYDALLIPCAFLLFAYVTKILLSDDNYRISTRDIVAVVFSCAFICATKIAYAILIIVLLSLSFKKFGSWKKYICCISLVAMAGILFYVIPILAGNAVASAATTTPNPLFEMQMQYISDNTADFLAVPFYSFDYFIGIWAWQFFGILGWLNVPFPNIFRIMFYMVLIASFIIDASRIKGISVLTRALSLCSVVIFYLFTMYYAYISWNPGIGVVGGLITYGIQGRYFIPIILFLMLVFSNPLLIRFKHLDKVVRIQERVSLITGIFCAILTVLALLLFFW